MNTLKAGCVAEFLGTFALTFFGAGSVILGHPDLLGAERTLLHVALAHGLILAAFIAGCGYVSGAQFNPAVAIAFVAAGKQSPARAGVYIAAQLLGAVCAAGMLQLLLTPAVANHEAVNLGATIGKFTSPAHLLPLIALEFIATFAMMFVILTSALDDRAPKMGGLFIALTVMACILAIGPLTGASMNPARTFGPAICGGHWDMHWVYWAAPIAGALAATGVYRAFIAAGARAA